MRTFLLPLLFLVCCYPVAHAQNWKTVSPHDTTRFAAGTHSQGLVIYGSGSAFMRVALIDSSGAFAGGDSIHHFSRTIRVESGTNCADTLAASWLGHAFIRKTDGIEYYFNSLGDTIEVHTLAAPGDSWRLAKGANGQLFRATVSQVSVQTIDGIPDSVKTATIQAYQNGNPVAHWYNQFVLQWSKAHGWIKVLDFYRFPNPVSGNDLAGAVIDSGQHTRLDGMTQLAAGSNAMTWKYAPGNEWVSLRVSGFQGNPVYLNRYYRGDSIISTNVLAADKIVVQFKTDTFHTFTTMPPGSPLPVTTNTSGSYLHTDTITWVNMTYNLTQVLPEVKDQVLAGSASVGQHIANRHFITTFCNRYLIRQNRYQGYWFHPPFGGTGCPLLYDSNGGSSLAAIWQNAYLQDFGSILSWDEEGQGPGIPGGGLIDRYEVTYLKIGNCIMGSRTDVSRLDVTPVSPLKMITWNVYPNPANDRLLLTASGDYTGQKAAATLYDPSGRKVGQVEVDGRQAVLMTAHYPAGLYFLEIMTEKERQVLKVSIQH